MCALQKFDPQKPMTYDMRYWLLDALFNGTLGKLAAEYTWAGLPELHRQSEQLAEGDNLYDLLTRFFAPEPDVDPSDRSSINCAVALLGPVLGPAATYHWKTRRQLPLPAAPPAEIPTSRHTLCTSG